MVLYCAQKLLLGWKEIRNHLLTFQSKLKSIEINWNSIESQLKSVETQLKLNWFQLKPFLLKRYCLRFKRLISIEILTWVDYPEVPRPGPQEIWTLKSIQNCLRGEGGRDTNQRPTLYIYMYMYMYMYVYMYMYMYMYGDDIRYIIQYSPYYIYTYIYMLYVCIYIYRCS